MTPRPRTSRLHRRFWHLAASNVALLLTATRSAAAQPVEPQAQAPEGEETSPAPEPAPRSEPAKPAAVASTAGAEKPVLKVTPTGYVEAYYAHNINRPANGITNFRGFDNRHGTFSIQNAALGANWETGPVSGRIMLQIGAVPSTYYAAEPALVGSGGANATGPELWKYLQEAFVTYEAPVGRGLLFQLGLCASPIGYEVFAVKDNWNWSRSNLFFGFPFYHTGLRATYAWTDELSTTLSVFNGWNSVVDNNEEKSIQSNITFKVPDRFLAQALYFGGIERPTGSPEGPYWRHHFDLVGQYDATTWLSFAAQGDYGWEPNRVGTARWIAGALYARVKAIERVYVALRGDRFHEHLATASGGRKSAPIFYGGVEWVSSGTATVDVKPHDAVSVRLEYRHDVADTPLYFKGNVIGSGSATAPFIADTRTQDTLLLGATAWF